MELEQVTKLKLPDGRPYTGWGYRDGTRFIPHGCGKKFFDGYYAYGNFKDGVLTGPAMVSHNYQMNACHFSNDRGNGWGFCMNSGSIVEFGFYQNSQLKVDLTGMASWYLEKMRLAERDENMLHMYTFNESHEVSELLIGYKGKQLGGNLTLCFMGFRLKPDGSLWIGTTQTRQLTGTLIHFRPDGKIDAGTFQNGKLVERESFQNILDEYFGTYSFEDNIFADLFPTGPKSQRQLEIENIRDEYRAVPEIKPNYDYRR